jgi:hypothetical protein
MSDQTKYDDLLDALAYLLQVHDDQALDAFLLTYVGAEEWGAAIERARARRKKALLRQMRPEFWSD